MRQPNEVVGSLLLVLLIASCAAPRASTNPMGNRDVILRDEIEESGAATAYDLVQSLRPQWLRTRGLSTLQQAAGTETVVIYLDNARLGPPAAMREVTLGSIQYLRFFNAPQATQRWGEGHLQGAILISTRAR